MSATFAQIESFMSSLITDLTEHNVHKSILDSSKERFINSGKWKKYTVKNYKAETKKQYFVEFEGIMKGIEKKVEVEKNKKFLVIGEGVEQNYSVCEEMVKHFRGTVEASIDTIKGTATNGTTWTATEDSLKLYSSQNENAEATKESVEFLKPDFIVLALDISSDCWRETARRYDAIFKPSAIVVSCSPNPKKSHLFRAAITEYPTLKLPGIWFEWRREFLKFDGKQCTETIKRGLRDFQYEKNRKVAEGSLVIGPVDRRTARSAAPPRINIRPTNAFPNC